MAGTDNRRGEGGAEREPDAGEPVIILVRPQLGENIGTAARAMLNCGLHHMRIVAPRDGWPNVKALNAASGADEVIGGAEVFVDAASAVADLHTVYATTARNREMAKPVMTPRHAAAEMRASVGAGSRTGVLFGPERTGLSNDEVALADAILEVPLNPAFASLNLAQAVLLVAYEWRASSDTTEPVHLPLGRTRPATKQELIGFLDYLEGELSERGFFPTADMRPKMARNIRVMFERIPLTRQDLQTLFGIFKTMTHPRPRGPETRSKDDSNSV